MNIKKITAIALMASASFAFAEDAPTTAAPGAPAAQTPPPTMDEIKALMDGAKWNDALKGISKAVPMLQKKDSGYDAYTLKMLSAECQMQLRNVTTAKYEFINAENMAKTKEQLAIPFATRTLLDNRDEKWRYVPRGKNADADGIDILDRTKRDAAITALYKDVMANTQTINRRVLGDRALPPLITFAGSLTDARKLEYAATKGETECDAIIKGLGQHATQSITNAVNDMNRQTDDIRRRANEVVDVTQNVPDPANPGRTIQRRIQQRRGITNGDAQNLRNTISTCNAIPGAVRDLQNALGNIANINNASNDARRVSDTAYRTLNDNYTQR